MGLLADGETYLCDTFDATEYVLVTYTVPPHGAPQTIANVKATPGQTISELEPEAYTTQASLNRDFIIQKSQLVLSSVLVIPAVGHRITEIRDGVTYVYEVMDQPGDGPWRWSGAEYKAYRIHATLISRS